MASCVLDHASQLLVPDKAALCALSHTGIGNFQALAVLVFPKGMCHRCLTTAPAMCWCRVQRTAWSA